VRVNRRDSGSVLALVPAGFLVLILLSALAVDSAVTYLGQQQLHDSLVAAANDAASASVDHASFYRSGKVVLNLATAEEVVCESLAAQRSSQLHDVKLWLAVGGPAVRVVAQADVDAVFGRALPGFGTRRVRASVDAVAATAPGQNAGPPPAIWNLVGLPCS
jgi:hypothetical protein